MKKADPVVREVLLVSLGELVITGIMYGIFALGGFWSLKVLWGGLVGCGLAISYYSLTAVSVMIASKKAANQDVAGGTRTMRVSMLLRFALIIVVIAMALKGRFVNPISLVVPMFLLRPVISVCELFRKSGEKNGC